MAQLSWILIIHVMNACVHALEPTMDEEKMARYGDAFWPGSLPRALMLRLVLMLSHRPSIRVNNEIGPKVRIVTTQEVRKMSKQPRIGMTVGHGSVYISILEHLHSVGQSDWR